MDSKFSQIDESVLVARRLSYLKPTCLSVDDLQRLENISITVRQRKNYKAPSPRISVSHSDDEKTSIKSTSRFKMIFSDVSTPKQRVEPKLEYGLPNATKLPIQIRTGRPITIINFSDK